jgi:hypothetical protein
MSKEVVKDVVVKVEEGLRDVLEGAAPAGIVELELVVEVTTPEKAVELQLELWARAPASSTHR